MSDAADEARPPATVTAAAAVRGVARRWAPCRRCETCRRCAHVVAAQLGRAPRAMRRVAHRCSCGLPDVVETAPRLPDGTPFPTLFYLTCPRAAAAVGRLESEGLMRQMNERLADRP